MKQGVNSAIDSEVFTLSPNSLLKLVGYETPQSLKELRIACIFDEFTMNCYKMKWISLHLDRIIGRKYFQ